MKHFAHVDGGVVLSVLAVHDTDDGQGYLNGLGLDGVWLETTFGAYGGRIWLDEETFTTENVIRYNHAAVGFAYDDNRDAFIPPKPDGDWLLDEATCLWVAS